MLPLPGLSPVGAKKIIAQFDGGLLSSDAGVLVLREVEQRLRVAERMAACIVDPRAPEQITHTLADIICFRLLMIAGGTRTVTTPTAFASIPSSRWRMIFRRRTAICVRSRRSRVWKICRTPARCCAWAAP